jgi:uncharacterized membrane protein
MKIFGHPLHIMLIHFPSALLPMDLVCSFLAFQTGNTSFAHAAFFAMTGGVLLGFLAIITGAYDLIGVAENKPLALKKALVHGGINATVIIVYSVLAFRAYKAFPDLTNDALAELVVKACLITLMIAGNYIGGSLILKHRVGHSDQP